MKEIKALGKHLKNCRVCKSDALYKFLDLGHTTPADEFRRADELEEPIPQFPLNAVICESCGFVQLDYVVDGAYLFQKEYPYESSVTETGRKHYFDFAKSIIDYLGLDNDELVIDVGSNVGVLLEGFKNNGMKVLGIDPAPNIVEKANKRGIDTMCRFFGEASAKEAFEKKGAASVITGTNVFAHIDDLDDVMRGVKTLLNDKGVFIFESPHLLTLYSNLEYDTIYHEHLSYISISPLVDFFAKFGMEIIKVEKTNIHGGSIRVFIGFIGNNEIDPSVNLVLEEEESAGLKKIENWTNFADRVEQQRQSLLALIRKLKSEGKTIVGLSAPAKGMTLLSHCKIGRETLEYITEKSELKMGKYAPVDKIPIVSDDRLIQDKPDYALLLAWNFSKEIIKNLDEYRKGGGKFIIPIPEPRIIE
jgi:2-polyprenyl-3-methyl-5-hydroxy-6-metoxy-1,4-benzoquinol methylase